MAAGMSGILNRSGCRGVAPLVIPRVYGRPRRCIRSGGGHPAKGEMVAPAEEDADPPSAPNLRGQVLAGLTFVARTVSMINADRATIQAHSAERRRSAFRGKIRRRPPEL